MRMRTALVAIVVVAIAGALAWGGFSAGSRDGLLTRPGAGNATALSSGNGGQLRNIVRTDEELAERLRTISAAAGGAVGITVTHVETGRTVAIHGADQLPLYSVFKLPLAVAVLKDVEENRIQLNKKVLITRAEVVPGWQGNTELWHKPVERTLAELLELSIMRSDNTSTDKLLQLVGGPMAVTKRMRSLGFQNFDIHSSVRDYVTDRQKTNTGTASDLAHLLVELHKGHILEPPQLSMLIGFMEPATTGERRLRGQLPAGTQVADKTGTGEAGKATNDVGLITLPEGRGHLAIAVLVSGSKLPADGQEKVIAELARVAYDAHLSQAGSATQ